MTSKERLKKICRFEPVDKSFIWSAASWNEALDRWQQEGMPVRDLSNMKQVNHHFLGWEYQHEAIPVVGAIFGMGKCGNPPWVVAIHPIFERKVLEEEVEHVVEVDYDGTIVRRRKHRDDTIPQVLEYPVKDRGSKTHGQFQVSAQISESPRTHFNAELQFACQQLQIGELLIWQGMQRQIVCNLNDFDAESKGFVQQTVGGKPDSIRMSGIARNAHRPAVGVGTDSQLHSWILIMLILASSVGFCVFKVHLSELMTPGTVVLQLSVQSGKCGIDLPIH